MSSRHSKVTWDKTIMCTAGLQQPWTLPTLSPGCCDNQKYHRIFPKMPSREQYGPPPSRPHWGPLTEEREGMCRQWKEMRSGRVWLWGVLENRKWGNLNLGASIAIHIYWWNEGLRTKHSLIPGTRGKIEREVEEKARTCGLWANRT